MKQAALFDPPGQLPDDPGATVVVRSHTRHIRKGIEKRNAKRPKRARQTLAERFEVFHQANPHVYARLVKMARDLRARGVQSYGIAALWEVLRYQSLTTTDTDSLPFKLSNNHRAYYARLINSQEPDLAGFFTTRTTRS